MPRPPRRARPPRDDRAGRHAAAPAAVAQHRHPARLPADTTLIWGVHAVLEALRSPRRTLLRLRATDGSAERVAQAASERGLAIEFVPPDDISGRLPRDAVHQGLLLEARPLEPIDIDDLPERGTVLVLDQLTDPHNVGAILRTAAAFAVCGLVMTDRNAPELSGTLAKAASGGLEHVPVARVVNLARALDQLAERGYFRIGLDSDGETSLTAAVGTGHPALALVLGAEGKGMRRLTRERCDIVARLDLPGPIKSLNVSNACAAVLTVVALRTNPQ